MEGNESEGGTGVTEGRRPMGEGPSKLKMAKSMRVQPETAERRGR